MNDDCDCLEVENANAYYGAATSLYGMWKKWSRKDMTGVVVERLNRGGELTLRR